MDIKKIVDEYLIVNSADDEYVYNTVVSRMAEDISAIYAATCNGSELSLKKITHNNGFLKKLIQEYVGCGCDDSNMGKTLLFLRSLPAIADHIENNIEKANSNISGTEHIVAKDNVDQYVQDLFIAGYNRLYKYEDRAQIGYHLYYECEKLIDMLVLEFKKDISKMIDENNLVYDDLYYVRRMLKNQENHLSNVEIEACVDCDSNCKWCKTFPERHSMNESLNMCRDYLAILDKKIMTGSVDQKDLQKIKDSSTGRMVRTVCTLEPDKFEHKKIHYSASPQILSITSAQRFEKILKRRYNDEAYRKDKDIYYILANGIDAKNIFMGDALLDDLDQIYRSYEKSNESQN